MGGGRGCQKFESFVGNLGGFALPPATVYTYVQVVKPISTSEVFLVHLSSFPCPKADRTSFGTMLLGEEKFALLYGALLMTQSSPITLLPLGKSTVIQLTTVVAEGEVITSLYSLSRKRSKYRLVITEPEATNCFSIISVLKKFYL